MRPRYALPVLLALFACADPPPPPPALNDFQRPIFVVNTGFTPTKGDTIQVLYHQEQVGACHDVKSAVATLDGVPLTRLHGVVKENGYDYNRDCETLEFSADPGAVAAIRAGAGPVSTAMITDGTTTASVTVAHLFTTRTMVASAPRYAPGETVTLTWSPAGDRVMPKAEWGIQLAAGGKTRFLPKAEVTLTPEAVTFVVPGDLDPAFVGPVSVEFRGTLALQPTVTACVWAVQCEASRVGLVEPVTVEITKG